ncbi:MAG: hypothetical protein RQM90_14915 [Methanoculleus sp.]
MANSNHPEGLRDQDDFAHRIIVGDKGLIGELRSAENGFFDGGFLAVGRHRDAGLNGA